MNKAFTLIELAIVLVIIGLITGGVLGAQSIIESAKMRGIITQFKNYDQAVAAFKLEYDYLPGDIPQSEAAAYGFNNCGTYSNGSGQTCGVDFMDGDKRIEGYNGTNSGSGMPMSLWGETYYFFLNLKDAELIDDDIQISPGSGSFCGCYQTGCLSDGRGGFIGVTDNSLKLHWYLGLENTQSIYNNHGLTSNGRMNRYNFTPKEMKAIDDKLDDGDPNLGFVKPSRIVYYPNITLDNRASECQNSSQDGYNLSESDLKCNPMIQSSVN